MLETDYGPVRISDDEYHILEVAENASRYGIRGNMAKRADAMAQTIKDACERFAKYRAERE